MKNENIAVNRTTGKIKNILETHNGFIILEQGKEIHTSSYGFQQDYKIRSLKELTCNKCRYQTIGCNLCTICMDYSKFKPIN